MRINSEIVSYHQGYWHHTFQHFNYKRGKSQTSNDTILIPSLSAKVSNDCNRIKKY